jgi:hypothetical protein
MESPRLLYIKDIAVVVIYGTKRSVGYIRGGDAVDNRYIKGYWLAVRRTRAGWMKGCTMENGGFGM